MQPPFGLFYVVGSEAQRNNLTSPRSKGGSLICDSPFPIATKHQLSDQHLAACTITFVGYASASGCQDTNNILPGLSLSLLRSTRYRDFPNCCGPVRLYGVLSHRPGNMTSNLGKRLRFKACLLESTDPLLSPMIVHLCLRVVELGFYEVGNANLNRKHKRGPYLVIVLLSILRWPMEQVYHTNITW